MATKAKVKVGNPYHQHRERQRRRILDAAKEIFDERGIDRTTMAEIMAATGLRASTLYEYFSKKDDIVWAIFSDMIEEDSARAKIAVEGATTGLAKIMALLEHMADQLSNDSAKIRFMAQFDAMYARDWPVERLLTLEGQLNDIGFEGFKKLIREGIDDGSLRRGLDPDLTLHAVINAVIGAQRRLASLGTKVELEYGQSIDSLFKEMIRIVEFGLRAPAPSNKNGPAPRVKARKGSKGKRTL
ncbi:TetR/AcrR family transcriptional regulator [Acidipila rosea]|uniref:TetR family transcriptional regulator n=1 Tax=Acidipila rosea TaxID=768535 RepID=A0A4R1LEN9_9BACT|nr:TetR/AcrR family transcriptional regulator [Acidipila rosea]TCK75303.1 TetR family transcriptional regulator [Acidipila rosea]